MNAQMNARFAVVRNSRTSTDQPWTRNYIGIMSCRKYRGLQREADDANSILSLEDRQKGGFVSYSAVAVDRLEGGVDGMALRTWIQGNTDGKSYDVRTAKLIDDPTPVYNPTAPVDTIMMTVDQLKDVHYAVRAYIQNGKDEAIATRLCRAEQSILQSIRKVQPSYAV